MNDVFISYKVHNRRTAIEYYKNLKLLNFQVWFDQLVPKMADWKKTIKDQIKKSNIFICLLSKECLLDDWVLFQIQVARKAHKKIYFITLDDTDWTQNKAYKVPEKTYTSLEEVCLMLFDDKSKINLTHSYQGINNFTVNFLTLAVCAFLVSSFGIHLFNLKLGLEFGLIIWGILTCIVLAYIPKKLTYILQGILAVVLLYLAIYIFPTYIVSNIPINTVFFLWFYLFGISLRFLKYSLWKSWLIALFYASFSVTVYSSLLVLFSYFWDYDCSWVSFIILISYFLYTLFHHTKEIVFKKKSHQD